MFFLVETHVKLLEVLSDDQLYKVQDEIYFS